jgi:hypothetical protein
LADPRKNPAAKALTEAPPHQEMQPQAIFRAICQGFSFGASEDRTLMVIEGVFPVGTAEFVFPMSNAPQFAEGVMQAYEEFRKEQKPDLTVVEKKGLVLPT